MHISTYITFNKIIKKELLGKYWNRAGELKEAYRKEGRFLTDKEAVQYKEAKMLK